ncbi:hypothetical protein, membrane [gut metagenome]|uniref:Uncharacterized protein n=1 Tax=gut metagenome TaxID=749906 RepID=J9GL04_9ZZZZ
MTSPSDSPTRLTLSATDGREVLLAEILESSAIKNGHWTRQEMNLASRDARELAGEAAEPALFLTVRSRLTLARLKPLIPNQETIGPVKFNIWPFILALMLSAFFCGALTDRFATDGARINLLSAPIILLLLWNLAVYVALLLNRLGLCPSYTRLPTQLLKKAFSRLPLSGLPTDSLKTRFITRWIACQDTYLRTEATRAFHFASLAFVIGLLASLGIRGIGTAYSVGWESTWLGSSPEWISVILRAIYDWIPLIFWAVPVGLIFKRSPVFVSTALLPYICSAPQSGFFV